MGRMHSSGKGIANSAIPYRRTPPSWVKQTPEEVVDIIKKLAKKGMKPSQIGIQLRDEHAIPQVKQITGNKILRILKAEGIAPDFPEDLYNLIKKAVSIRKHLESCKKKNEGSKEKDVNYRDKDSKYRLILVEARIHRLSRYYKRAGKIAANWKYDSQSASIMVA